MLVGSYQQVSKSVLTLTFVTMVTAVIQLYALGTVDIKGAAVLSQCGLGFALSLNDLAASSDTVTGPIRCALYNYHCIDHHTS